MRGEKDTTRFTSSPAKYSSTKDKARSITEMAGLLHDIGHTALGHTFELLTERINLDLTHEDLSGEIASDPESEIGYP